MDNRISFLNRKFFLRVGFLLLFSIIASSLYSYFTAKANDDLIQSSPRLLEEETINTTAVNIELAKNLYDNDKAIFIDARNKGDFVAGHIPGAINIPVNGTQLSSWHSLQNISKNKLILTYCSGETCELSLKLARILENLGYMNTRVFFGGWQEWQEAGYPISKGYH